MNSRKVLVTSLAYFQKLDVFGVSYKPYIIKDSNKYTSPFGGLITIIIYLVSSLYFIYLFNAWLNNQIQAKVSETTILQREHSDYFYSKSPVTVDLIMYNQSVLAGKKIFDFKFTYYVEQQEFFAYNQSNDYKCDELNDKQFQSKESGCLDLTKIRKDIFKNSSYNTIMLYVLKCDPTENDNCATDDEIKEALKMKGSLWLRITSMVEQYDYIENKINKIPKLNFIPFSLDQSQYVSQFTEIAEVSIDNGMLLQNIEQINYVKDYSLSYSQFDIQYSNQLFFQRTCYLQFQLGLSSKISQIRIQTVKISEILAQISSIFDIIMLLKILAKFYNQEKLSFNLYKTIIQGEENKKKITFVQNLMFKLNVCKNQELLSLWEKEINIVLKKQNIFYQFKKMHNLESQLKQLTVDQVNDGQSSIDNPGDELLMQLKRIKIHPSPKLYDESQSDDLKNTVKFKP